jgi:hypothetical protein
MQESKASNDYLDKISELYFINDKGIYPKKDNNLTIDNKLDRWCLDNNNLKKSNLKSYNEKKTAANITSTITTIQGREYINPIDKNLIFSSGDFGLSLSVKVNDTEIFETSSIVDDFDIGTYEENKKIIEEYIHNLENNYVNLLMYLHQEKTSTKPVENTAQTIQLDQVKFFDPSIFDKLIDNIGKKLGKDKLPQNKSSFFDSSKKPPQFNQLPNNFMLNSSKSSNRMQFD